MTIRDILETKGANVLSVEPDEPLTIAAALMARRRIGALVCREKGGAIVGIVTERDIIRVFGDDPELAVAAPVSAAMTEDVKTCSPDDSMRDAFDAMTAGHFRHMPVADGKELVGLISATDVLRHLSSASDPAEAQRLLVAFVNEIDTPEE